MDTDNRAANGTGSLEKLSPGYGHKNNLYHSKKCAKIQRDRFKLFQQHYYCKIVLKYLITTLTTWFYLQSDFVYWFVFLLLQKADIGAAPIYITDHRAKVVDFSLPFLNVQATLLLRKPPIGQSLRIKSVTDLLNQSEIKYGTLDTGLLLWSFRNTNDSALKLIYRTMTRFYPSVFTESNEEGIQKGQGGKICLYFTKHNWGIYFSKSSM